MNGNGFDSNRGHNGHGNRLPGDSGSDSKDDPEKIKDKMAFLRRGLQHDAEQLARSAQQATDWKFYVEKFPLVCAGVALLVGYAVVPKKTGPIRASDEQLQRLAKAGQLKVVADPAPGTKPSLLQKAAFALGSIAIKAALNHVGQSVSNRSGFHTATNGRARQGEP